MTTPIVVTGRAYVPNPGYNGRMAHGAWRVTPAVSGHRRDVREVDVEDLPLPVDLGHEQE